MALVGLEERERIERLERDGDAVSAAYRTNFAFASVKDLENEQRLFEARLGVDLRAIEDAAIEAELTGGAGGGGSAARGDLTPREEEALDAILRAMFANGGAAPATPTEEH